jgi:translation initiation factor 3 subunit K
LFFIPNQKASLSAKSCYFIQFDYFIHIFFQAINIEGLALDKFMEYHAANSGWVIEKGERSQLIVLPRNEFNHPELKKNTADTVPFEHITRIFPILS